MLLNKLQNLLPAFIKSKKILVLPLPKNQLPENEIAIYSLLSHDMVYMFIYSIRNFFFAASNIYSVYVIDNGSLTVEDIKQLRLYIPLLQFISKQECLTYLPSSIHLSSPFIYKLAVPNYIPSKKTIYLDPDVLFVNYYSDISQWLENGGNFFMKDVDTYYSFPIVDLNTYFHKKITKNLNAGFLIFETQSVSKILLKTISQYLTMYKYFHKKIVPLSFNEQPQWYIDQTVWALIFTQLNGKALSDKFWVYARTGWMNESLPRNVTGIHFSGPFKGDYWKFLEANVLKKTAFNINK